MNYKNSINSKNSLTFKSIFLGIVFGIFSCLILLTIFSFILIKIGYISNIINNILIYFTSAVSSFVSAYISLRILKKHGLFYGILIGFLLFLFFFIVGFFIERNTFTLFTLIRFFIMIIMGALGGIISANR